MMTYQGSILNGDLDKAATLIKQIPESFHGKLAKFLEANNQK